MVLAAFPALAIFPELAKPASVEILHQTLHMDPMSTRFSERELLVVGKGKIKGQANMPS